ncbi:hypothetical protein ACHHV8_33175 [Paenibacillus sp. TAB 01]|uniref:hypothetical protein n=1 Tax=Paenibacillus sp. TAB 01 TaxID=3368988 RepID=UPI003750848D
MKRSSPKTSPDVTRTASSRYMPRGSAGRRSDHPAVPDRGGRITSRTISRSSPADGFQTSSSSSQPAGNQPRPNSSRPSSTVCPPLKPRDCSELQRKRTARVTPQSMKPKYRNTVPIA